MPDTDSSGLRYRFPQYQFRVRDLISEGHAPILILKASGPQTIENRAWCINKDNFPELISALQKYAFKNATGLEHQA